MCGIIGIIQKNNINKNILSDMMKEISHRGPDYKKILYKQLKDKNIGFGHKRLSIIDLSKLGHQPMISNDKNTIITFNGEIYNYLEIKKDLLKKGYKFISKTDTEIVMYGYQEYGTNIFSKLNGMFSIALYDFQNDELILARDRMGQKPLYYWHNNQSFAFASELSALLKYPKIKKEININNLQKYLAFEYIPTPDSLIKNVYKLPQGSFLKLKNDNIKIEKYWEISFNNELIYYSQKELEEMLINKLTSSISKRLMSDVPLGVFLSGGIDSSAIVALLNEITDISKVKTFSIGFTEKSFDESNYANQVAKHFGTQHYQKILNPKIMIDILPNILEKMDEPISDASIIPTYLLSKFTRENVKVALGGDGGDELFAGYDPFLAHYFAKKYQKIPKNIHNFIINPIANKIPVSYKNMSLDFKIKNFLREVHKDIFIRNQRWLGSFTPEQQKKILHYDILKKRINPYKEYIELQNQIIYRDDWDQITFQYQKFYLADDILVKIDRASMMNSLEARSPFLDVDFVEFANNIPSKFKIKNNIRKFILKKSLEKYLPKNILYRPKKGFGIPLAKWIKKELKEEIAETLNFRKLKNQNIFNPLEIHKIIDSHLKNRYDYRKQIWTLYILQKWLDKTL